MCTKALEYFMLTPPWHCVCDLIKFLAVTLYDCYAVEIQLLKTSQYRITGNWRDRKHLRTSCFVSQSRIFSSETFPFHAHP